MLRKITYIFSLKKIYDDLFILFLKNEVYYDFKITTDIIGESDGKIPGSEQPEALVSILDSLKEKYKPNGECSCLIFPNISKDLKDEYNRAHERICCLLYRSS